MPSDSLDIEDHAQLAGYLRQRDPSGQPLEFRTLAGGVSNRTVRVKFENGDAWVIKQALAKLRTKADWFSDPSRVHREALGMRWLNRLVPGSVPEFVFEDFESHLLAMQAVPEPHENWKEMLLAGKLALAHVEQFATLLGAMHRRAAESTEDLKSAFADCSFFESLRLEPYYGYAANRLPESREFLIDLMRDTQVRHLTLVHGDFSPKNVLVHDGRLLLLDHEVIHWGDPAFDLGFALTHMMSKLHHVRGRKYARAVPEFCRTYSAVVGPVYWDDNLEAMAVRHTIGCLLARVAGRSPLEYLDHRRRQKQQAFALAAMLRPPSSIEQLLMGFLLETGPYGDD